MNREQVREARTALAAIEPYPSWHSGLPVTALSLARYLAVHAQLTWAQQMEPASGGIDPAAVAGMSAQFAAARALLAFAGVDTTAADDCAKQIRGAWEDGGNVGEMLWDQLGEDVVKQVSALAAQIPAARSWSDRDRLLALAAKWDTRSDTLRAEFAGDSRALAALAGGHREANLLRDLAAELRATLETS